MTCGKCRLFETKTKEFMSMNNHIKKRYYKITNKTNALLLAEQLAVNASHLIN